MELIEAIGPSQLNPQPDGTATVSILDPTGLTCYDPPSPPRPAIVGDVYSVQPPGNVPTLVARPAGTAGPWEKAVTDSGRVVWAPQGKSGPCYVMPFAASVPIA